MSKLTKAESITFVGGSLCSLTVSCFDDFQHSSKIKGGQYGLARLVAHPSTVSALCLCCFAKYQIGWVPCSLETCGMFVTVMEYVDC